MTYELSEIAYTYDVENIFNLFGLQKVKEGGDIKVWEGDFLFIRGAGVDLALNLDSGSASSKNALKRELFRALEAILGKRTHWGILVGVRPVKIATVLLSSGLSPEDVVSQLQSEYLLDESKARLIVEVAEHERRIVAETEADGGVSLYLSVPFCPTRCSYCSFPMVPLQTKKKLLEPYYACLAEELELLLRGLTSHKRSSPFLMDCIYFGGGTPSTLTPQMIEGLFAIMRKYLDLTQVKEITFEAGRTDTIDPDLIRVLAKNGVHRISVNPQSFTESALIDSNRTRLDGEFDAAFAFARDAGLVINSDMILGIGTESEVEYLEGLRQLIALRPENITIHALSLKSGSVFREHQLNATHPKAVEEVFSKYSAMSLCGDAMLRAAGYVPYYMYRQKRTIANLENIGYSLPGHGCLYNSRIMSEKSSIYACGVGAVSKICYPAENRHEQFANSRSVEDYIENFDKVRAHVEMLVSLS